MLSATEASKLRSNIHKMVLNIGKTNGTKLPESKNNRAPIAMQYWLMSFLSKMVHGMMEDAKKTAIKEGVLFDHAEEPLPVGTEKIIFSCDIVQVSVKVKRPATRLNQDELKHSLRVDGVKEHIIEKAFRDATEPTRAPHEFSAVLMEKPD